MELLDVISSLLTLIMLEIILGIDNLIFLFVLTDKLPRKRRQSARHWGLTFSWVARLVLLAIVVELIKFTRPLIIIGDFYFSARELFLLVGGLFLLTKATQEIHYQVSKEASKRQVSKEKIVSFKGIVLQIVFMDIIFSLDSVLTAVGLTTRFWVMSIAITCAILVMVYASVSVSRFIDKYPAIKMLALSFLMLIGLMLIADSFSFHMPRGYIYFAMGFSLAVEVLNIVRNKK